MKSALLFLLKTILHSILLGIIMGLFLLFVLWFDRLIYPQDVHFYRSIERDGGIALLSVYAGVAATIVGFCILLVASAVKRMRQKAYR